MRVSLEYVAFYDFRLLVGEMLTEADPDSLILLNESAVKAFGWHDPVGKHLDGFTVKGVIKNVYNFAPTIQVSPILYLQHFGKMQEQEHPDHRLFCLNIRKGRGKHARKK